MVAPPPAASTRHDGPLAPSPNAGPLKLVAVCSERPHRTISQGTPAVSFSIRLDALAAAPRRVRYTRIAAHTVASSAAWMLQRSGQRMARRRLVGELVMAPGGVSELPRSIEGILALLEHEEGIRPDHKAMAAAIVVLRSADAVVAGPFSPEDVLAPGLVPHMAELASGAYRALRPSAELIAEPGFGQLARRFHFIQMSYQDARWLGAGAVDIGALAQSLRRVQDGQGEFAITSFRGSGILWAEDRWWEINPIGSHVDEACAAAAFTTAWVVARRFLRAPAAQALSYARSAALNSTFKNRSEV